MKGLRIKLRGAFALLILLASCAGYQEAEKALAPGFPQEESISAPSMSEASKAPSAVAEDSDKQGIYDSLVILDNFRWHEYDAVGTTDPLN